MTFASGGAYEGHFVAGKRHGIGAYHYPSGVVTAGHFLADRLVGVGLRWSADRRRAWALLEGKVEPQNYRVAPPDATPGLNGGWPELEYDKQENGQVRASNVVPRALVPTCPRAHRRPAHGLF